MESLSDKTGGAGKRPVFFLVSHSTAGGLRELWNDLAQGFEARGYPVQRIALYPPETDGASAPDSTWSHIVPVRPGGVGGVLALMRALVARFRQDRPGYVISAMPAANVMAAVAARIAGSGTQVIISHHSPVETHNRILTVADAQAGALTSVRAIVSVSNTVARSLDGKPARYRAKRTTIYNALPERLDTLLADLAARHRPRVARSRTVVATGRLSAQKNYPLLLRAAALLPDVSFEIVGDGEDEGALRQLAADLGVTDRVHFRGYVPRDRAMALLAEGDVFAQLSLYEGHSLALIEAAKLGLPLVVSDVPVQLESITAGDGTLCGTALGIDDAEGVAQAIRRLLDDPDHYRDQAARSAKLAAESTFETMIGQYLRLMQDR